MKFDFSSDAMKAIGKLDANTVALLRGFTSEVL